MKKRDTLRKTPYTTFDNCSGWMKVRIKYMQQLDEKNSNPEMEPHKISTKNLKSSKDKE